jgi:alpha-1,6-mannosyltransferase
LLRRADLGRQLSVICLAGAVGSTIITLTSWWVAAIPSTVRADPPALLSLFPFGGALPRVCYYIGLAVVMLTWLGLGRWLLVHGRPLRPRDLFRYVVSVAAPLLVAAPIASRDLWAYAAQGNMMVKGINPYVLGPFTVPGPFTDEMSPRWVFSPAPYGPLWMQIAHALVGISGDRPTVAVLLLRLPSLFGVLLAAWTLPALARRLGGRVELGLWLGVASPLFLVLGVGGGHNDLLMVGLMVAGLAVVCQGSWTALALGSAVLGAASVVKTPAVAGLAFAVPIWLHVRQPHVHEFPPVRKIVSSAAVVGAVGVATMTIATVGSGLGWAWVHEISSDISVVNWLSAPTAVAILVKLVTGHVSGATTLDASMHSIRAIGSTLTGVMLAVLWFVALRRAPLTCLVIGLAAAAVLVPAVQPWYYCWALVLAGLVVTRRWLWLVLMTLTLSSVIMIRPNGEGLQMDPAVINIIAGSAVACWLALRTRQPAPTPTSAPNHDCPEDAGTKVSADDRAEL